MDGEPIRLRVDETGFRGARGDEVVGSGYRLVDPPDDLPRDVRRVKVAGVSHRREALQSPVFAPGQELALVPEPDNEYDADAVGVWDSRKLEQVGYLPADVARKIGRRLARGRVSKVISLWEWKQAGSGERVGLEILIAPDLPVEIVDRDSPGRE
jgi:hypothetical protein